MRFSWMAVVAALAITALFPACYSRSKAQERWEAAQGGAPAAPQPDEMPIPASDVVESTPAAKSSKARSKSMSAKYSRPGFAVYEDDGRLWVFELQSKHHDEFRRSGEPAKSVTKVGAGPNGMTVRGAESDVIDSYVDAMKFGRPGFAVFGAEGRLWVFALDGEGLQEFLASGEPAKSVTRIGVGPEGKTVRSDEASTIDAYVKSWGGSMPAPAPAMAAAHKGPVKSGFFSRPGFEVFEEDGRLWVFKSNSKALATFEKHGEPAKSVTRVGAGPGAKTVRGADGDVIGSYVDATKYGKSGFAVFGAEGRLWVFEAGGEGLREFLESGEPAKSVTKIGVGPDGKTIRSDDASTIDAYVAAWN